ncbi:MAG TPA: putative Ig domain-containing protein [Bryobacteraceae bacterium]|nr:putative Ig domain-containing protein [Bryobacteraceae bacterium]
MDLSVFGRKGAVALGGLLALTFSAGSMRANNLLAYTYTTGSPAVTCNTATGAIVTQTILVKASPSLTGTSTVITVSFTAPGGGLTVTPPSGAQTLSSSNQTTGLTFTVGASAGCAGMSAGTNIANVVQFRTSSTNPTVAVANDNAANMNSTLTAAASALVASAVTVTCSYNPVGPVYTPGPAQTVSVTSAATGGTPFTVDASSLPAWLTLATNPTGPSAGASPVTFTVQAVSPCNSTLAGTSTTSTFNLLNSPAPAKAVSVTVQVLPLSPLVATPSAPQLTYVKGSGTAGYVDVQITSAASPSPFFAINTATMPIWLTADSTSGTAPASPSYKNIRFSTTNVADSLAIGIYKSTIRLSVSGSADLSLTITLQINNKAPKLTVAEGTTRNISWTIGAPLPAPYITVVSSDSPISYTATTAGTLAPVISATQQKGLAYSFGTQIGVTFNPLIFAAATPGSSMTGTVTLTYGSPAATIVVTFTVTVSSPGATLTGVTPASIPTAAAGTVFTVVLTGTGFVPSTDPTLKTKVGIIPNQTGTAITFDTNIGVTVTNASNLTLVITVPAVADTNLPFSPTGNGGTVMFGICNPGGATCSTASSTISITIGSGPIIQAITSSSTFQQVTAPTLPSIAPYDMITIWGSNFCTSGGTGCGSTQLLLGSPDAVSYRYPATLSIPTPVTTPPTNPDPRALTVTFLIHGGAAIQNAPLLFATNGQINALVPAAVATYIGSTVDIQVNWGTGAAGASPQTLFQSAKYQVNVVATDPGIFAVGADGQGQGAILGQNYSLISQTNPAGMRSGSDSDAIMIYVTGLGAPDAGADNSSTGTVSGIVFPDDCISVGSYETSLNNWTGSTSWTNVDGNVILSSLLNTRRYPPCVGGTNPVTVTVGGINAPVTYSGFVADTIAGLYQINAQLPATTPGGSLTPLTGNPVTTLTAPLQLPVVVTSNGVPSQNGVTVWVTPRLAVAAPTVISGTVGLPWTTPNNLVVASEGTPPYHYALTSGVLPAGLILTAAGNGSPAAGAITGMPAANTAGTYIVTITATDSAVVPVTGSVTFTITIAGGLYMTTAAAPPYTIAYGTGNATLTPVITATGGQSPYTFAVTVSQPTAGSPAPLGMTVSSTGRIVMSSLIPVPAGTYHVNITATDSGATPLTGSVNLDVVVSLGMSHTTPVTQTNNSGLVLTTVTATSGNPSGTIVYSIDAASAALNFHINAATGALDTGTAVVTGGGGVDVIIDAVDSIALPTGAAVFGAGQTTVHVIVN